MSDSKIIIYQLLPRLFGNQNTNPRFNGSRNENGVGKFDQISDIALNEIRKFGVTHVWYTGIIEHAIVEGYPKNGIPNGNPLIIKGKAGSPYAIKDYYDVNPDLAVDVDKRMEEFQSLIDRTHCHNLKVIIDFVPNHLAREYHSDAKPEGVIDFGAEDKKSIPFSASNNFYYISEQKLTLPEEIRNQYSDIDYEEYPAKATGNDQFSASPSINDWYETIKLNYGVDYIDFQKKHFDPIPNTWLKMKDILLFWANKGVDGFRCDMAEMVPVEFWNWVISAVKAEFPQIIFIAEVYNPSLYDNYISIGKFDYLYDKVGLYDTLKGIIQGHQSAKDITLCWQSLSGLDKLMLRFLENHDEQRIASPFFAEHARKALPAMVVSVCLNRGPAMIYCGQEVGESGLEASGFSGKDGRTSIFDYWNLPEHQKWMNSGNFDGALLSNEQKRLRGDYQNILKLATQPAIAKGEFYDIMWQNNNPDLLNSNKIYAFLRHTTDQKLLIVCNFDSQIQHMSLKLPAHAMEVMNIPNHTNFRLHDFFTQSEFNINSEEITTKGVKLQVSAYGYLIFELNY